MAQSYTGLVLSGGQGRRMGGIDKGLVPWQGRPLAAWVADQLRPQVSQLLISCNRNEARYAEWADALVGDQQQDYCGPLAGIREGLRAMRASHLLVAPCDLPAIDQALLHGLLKQAGEHPEQIAVVRQGEGLQPLLCVVPAALQAAIEAAWQAGERSPNRLWQRLGCVTFECAADDPRLVNFNCPEVLAQASEHPEDLRRCYANHR